METARLEPVKAVLWRMSGGAIASRRAVPVARRARMREMVGRLIFTVVVWTGVVGRGLVVVPSLICRNGDEDGEGKEEMVLPTWRLKVRTPMNARAVPAASPTM